MKTALQTLKDQQHQLRAEMDMDANAAAHPQQQKNQQLLMGGPPPVPRGATAAGGQLVNPRSLVSGHHNTALLHRTESNNEKRAAGPAEPSNKPMATEGNPLVGIADATNISSSSSAADPTNRSRHNNPHHPFYYSPSSMLSIDTPARADQSLSVLSGHGHAAHGLLSSCSQQLLQALQSQTTSGSDSAIVPLMSAGAAAGNNEKERRMSNGEGGGGGGGRVALLPPEDHYSPPPSHKPSTAAPLGPTAVPIAALMPVTSRQAMGLMSRSVHPPPARTATAAADGDATNSSSDGSDFSLDDDDDIPTADSSGDGTSVGGGREGSVFFESPERLARAAASVDRRGQAAANQQKQKQNEQHASKEKKVMMPSAVPTTPPAALRRNTLPGGGAPLLDISPSSPYGDTACDGGGEALAVALAAAAANSPSADHYANSSVLSDFTISLANDSLCPSAAAVTAIAAAAAAGGGGATINGISSATPSAAASPSPRRVAFDPDALSRHDARATAHMQQTMSTTAIANSSAIAGANGVSPAAAQQQQQLLTAGYGSVARQHPRRRATSLIRSENAVNDVFAALTPLAISLLEESLHNGLVTEGEDGNNNNTNGEDGGASVSMGGLSLMGGFGASTTTTGGLSTLANGGGMGILVPTRCGGGAGAGGIGDLVTPTPPLFGDRPLANAVRRITDERRDGYVRYGGTVVPAAAVERFENSFALSMQMDDWLSNGGGGGRSPSMAMMGRASRNGGGGSPSFASMRNAHHHHGNAGNGSNSAYPLSNTSFGFGSASTAGSPTRSGFGYGGAASLSTPSAASAAGAGATATDTNSSSSVSAANKNANSAAMLASMGAAYRSELAAMSLLGTTPRAGNLVSSAAVLHHHAGGGGGGSPMSARSLRGGVAPLSPQHSRSLFGTSQSPSAAATVCSRGILAQRRLSGSLAAAIGCANQQQQNTNYQLVDPTAADATGEALKAMAAEAVSSHQRRDCEEGQQVAPDLAAMPVRGHEAFLSSDSSMASPSAQCSAVASPSHGMMMGDAAATAEGGANESANAAAAAVSQGDALPAVVISSPDDEDGDVLVGPSKEAAAASNNNTLHDSNTSSTIPRRSASPNLGLKLQYVHPQDRCVSVPSLAARHDDASAPTGAAAVTATHLTALGSPTFDGDGSPNYPAPPVPGLATAPSSARNSLTTFTALPQSVPHSVPMRSPRHPTEGSSESGGAALRRMQSATMRPSHCGVDDGDAQGADVVRLSAGAFEGCFPTTPRGGGGSNATDGAALSRAGSGASAVRAMRARQHNASGGGGGAGPPPSFVPAVVSVVSSAGTSRSTTRSNSRQSSPSSSAASAAGGNRRGDPLLPEGGSRRSSLGHTTSTTNASRSGSPPITVVPSPPRNGSGRSPPRGGVSVSGTRQSGSRPASPSPDDSCAPVRHLSATMANCVPSTASAATVRKGFVGGAGAAAVAAAAEANSSCSSGVVGSGADPRATLTIFQGRRMTVAERDERIALEAERIDRLKQRASEYLNYEQKAKRVVLEKVQPSSRGMAVLEGGGGQLGGRHSNSPPRGITTSAPQRAAAAEGRVGALAPPPPRPSHLAPIAHRPRPLSAN